MLKILVLATTNKNKIKEFENLLDTFNIELKSIADFGPLPGAVEDGVTFDDNAYKKALHYAKVLGLPTIADDSGLVVEALHGEPGVYSARYAGPHATDEQNCLKLLEKLKGESNRAAAFQCVLSVAVPSGPALTYEGSCSGQILDTFRGSNGFGYDPLFYYPQLGKTFAELSIEEKNGISHRAQALREFAQEFPKVCAWLEQRLKEEKPEKPDHSEFEDNDWSS